MCRFLQLLDGCWDEECDEEDDRSRGEMLASVGNRVEARRIVAVAGVVA